MPPLVRRFSCITLLPKENAEAFWIEEVKSRRGQLELE